MSGSGAQDSVCVYNENFDTDQSTPKRRVERSNRFIRYSNISSLGLK